MNIVRPENEEMMIVGIAVTAKSPDASVLAKLTEQDFCNSHARTVFRSIRSLLNQQQKLALETLDEDLTRRFGAEKVHALMQPILANAAEYKLNAWQLPRLVNAVLEGAKRRKMQRIGEHLAQSAVDETQPIPTVLTDAQAALRNCIHSKAQIVSGADACLEAYDAAFATEQPISTEISELDTILCGGLHRGELTVCGARPAVGKSAVLLQIAMNAAAQGKHVLFVSLEMSKRQIGARILAAKSGVNAAILRSGGNISEHNGLALADGIELAGKSGIENLLILAEPGTGIESLMQETQALADSDGIDLVVVDYLQLLGSNQRHASDFERLGIVSRGLKRLSLSLDVPVLAAAQVRRQNNGGILRAPGLDELRGSGDIEQDADNVWLLHRIETLDDPTLKTTAYTNRHTGLFEGAQMQKRQLMSIEVAKQRQGATARAWFMFDSSRMHFFNPFNPDRKEAAI